MTRYVPILKGKQGEFGALGLISLATRQEIQPLIELVPPSEDDTDASAGRVAAHKAATALGRCWAASIAFIDAGYFELDLPLPSGLHMIGEACALAEAAGVGAVPVIRLDDPTEARQDVRQLHADHGRGACLRLYNGDLDTDGEALDSQIEEFLRETTLQRPDIDLLIDAGYLDGDIAASTNARAIRLILRELDRLADYRSVTVAAGAFPDNLQGVVPWTITPRQRYDADMWITLVARGVPREVDYGDYAINHPVLAFGGWRPAPGLRYTADQEWLILRGTVNDPRAHDQFFDICDQIAAHPQFAGAGLGTADRRIANSRAETNGNATTWRQIGTTHHLDFVVQRLTNLGEP